MKNKKLKPLKPSIREKKRYLLIKGGSVSKEKIEKAILEFIGILGYSEASPTFIKKQTGNDEGLIISVNRKAVDKVRASLAVYPEKMTIVKVSGTLKGLAGK